MKAPALLIVAGLLLIGCSPYSGSTRPLGPGDETLKTRLDALANVGKVLGWDDGSLPSAVATQVGGGVGFRILKWVEGKAQETVVWSEKDRDKAVVDAAKQNLDTVVVPVYHVRPWANQISPLPEAASQWTPAQLAEWLVWEWSANRGGADSPAKLSRNSFVAYKFAEAMLIKWQGAGSGDLARWREGVRDRQTFEELTADLRQQVRGIVAAQKEPVERAATLDRIQTAWINNFQQQYPTRFLTNRYQDFGDGGPLPPLTLETLGDETLGWSAWDSTRVWDDAKALWKAVQATTP